MPTVSILPRSGRPRLPETEFRKLLDPYGIDLEAFPLVVCGLRGFFATETGQTPGNERNLYDDALFLWAPNLQLFSAFNGNTDPSALRVGRGTGSAKGTAVLNPGVWYAYRFAQHVGSKTRYDAICQRAADVTVTRDGNPPYPDRGRFGINIHRGGYYTTSSEGCQTIPPDQWPEFIGAARKAGQDLFGAAFDERVIPYVLIDVATLPAPDPEADEAPPQRAERFLRTVIRPTLERIGLPGRPAENLLLGTALAASGLTDRTQVGGGPALGLFQMTPAQHDDLWRNYLRFREALAASVASLANKVPGRQDAADLEKNDAYACAMARVRYLRVPNPLPPADDLLAQARYWKAHYDTAGGAGTVQSFVDAWKRSRP